MPIFFIAAIATSSSDQPETVVAAAGDNGKHTSIVCLDHEETHVAHEGQPSSTKQPVENEHEGMDDLDVKSSSPSSKDAPLQGWFFTFGTPKVNEISLAVKQKLSNYIYYGGKVK